MSNPTSTAPVEPKEVTDRKNAVMALYLSAQLLATGLFPGDNAQVIVQCRQFLLSVAKIEQDKLEADGITLETGPAPVEGGE